MNKPVEKKVEVGSKVRLTLGAGKGKKEVDGEVESFTESGGANVKTTAGFLVRNVAVDGLTVLNEAPKKFGQD